MTRGANDGSKLENLVALIEGLSLPTGFNMEQRKPVRDDEGKQIAELDIFITGRIGSVESRTLIECRDRPSEGRAPSSWIEQLFGRRKRLNVDSIVAVSTTGFVDEAVRFAAQENIRLRTCEYLTAEDVCSWLPFYSPQVTRHPQLINVRIYGGVPANLPAEDIVETRTRLPNGEGVFRHKASGTPLGVGEIFDRLAKSQKTFESLPWIIGTVRLEVIASQESCEQYSVDIAGKIVPVARLEFTADIHHTQDKMPLVHVAEYKGETGTQVLAHWEDDLNGQSLTMIATKRQEAS
jgi:hypothetical protein